MSKKRKKNAAQAQDDHELRKRERRAARKAQREAERRRQRRMRRLRNGAIAGVVLAGVGLLVFTLVRPGPELEGVEKLSSSGRDHLDPGASFDYGEPAPTSGPHDARSPSCGASSEPLPLTLAVHALEHGAVVVWHRPDIGEDAHAALLDLMRTYDSHVIVSPNSEITDPIVATAWNRRMRFQDARSPQLAEFVDTYRNRGPESVACPI